MKASDVKLKIKKRGLILGGITLLCLGAAIGAKMVLNSALVEIQQLEGEKSRIEGEISTKQSEYNEAKENLRIYLKVPDNKKPTDLKFNLGYQRIKTIYTEIEEYKKKYKFKGLSFTLSEVALAPEFTAETFEVYKNNIIVDYEGVSDMAVFSFFDDLKNTIYGYPVLKKIDFTTNEEINSENIRKYITDNTFSFVNGKVEFDWYVLKKKEDAAAAAGGQAADPSAAPAPGGM